MAESFEELGKTFPDSIIGFNAVAIFAKMVWDSAQAVEALKPSHNTQSEPCLNHGRAGIRIVSMVACDNCGQPVDSISV
jgi:hypothetical protein